MNAKWMLGLACLAGILSPNLYAFQGQAKTIQYLNGTTLSSFQLPDIQPAGGQCQVNPVLNYIIGGGERIYQEGLYPLTFDSIALSLTDMYIRTDLISPVDCAETD